MFFMKSSLDNDYCVQWHIKWRDNKLVSSTETVNRTNLYVLKLYVAIFRTLSQSVIDIKSLPTKQFRDFI
jgi:hypothetical protein